MSRTDDPIADFNRWDAEETEYLASLPVCAYCDEPIQQEKAIYYNDNWCCEECEEHIWFDIREDFLERVDD